MKKLQIGVIGSAGPEEYPLRKPNQKMYDSAREVGEILARKNCIIVCGGKGGIMEAVCLGAKKENGVTVAEVAGEGRFAANEFVDVEIVTQDTGFRGASQFVGDFGPGSPPPEPRSSTRARRSPTIHVAAAAG